MVKGNILYTAVILLTSAVVGWSGQIVKSPLSMPRLTPGSAPFISADTTDTTITTWLSYDDGSALYYFPLPDEWDDHYFNVRFTVPAEADSCLLLRAAFLFRRVPGDSTSISRDIMVVVFRDTLGLLPPGNPAYAALDSVKLPGDSVLVYPETTYVDLSPMNLYFNTNIHFHVGWEPDYADTDSTVGYRALLADDGIPETNYSCEWWGADTTWGTIAQDWGHSANFMLRVEIEEFLSIVNGVPRWLSPDHPAAFDLQGPYPNPFNPSATLFIQLQRPQEVKLQVWDMAGRLVQEIAAGTYPAGRNAVFWTPQNLPSGTYAVILKSGSQSVSAKALYIK